MPAFASLLSAMRRRPLRSALALVLMVALAGYGGSTAANRIAVNRHLRAAELANRRYDFVAARQHLQQALLRQPRAARAQLLAARGARRLDDYAESEHLLTAFEQAHGVTDESQLEWLLLTVQQGDLSAEKDFVAIIGQRPADAALMREALGKGYVNTTRWGDLFRLAGRVLQDEPGDVPALVFHGRALFNLRQREAALEDYQRAVERAPDATWARFLLAEVLSHLGFNHEALDHFERLRQRLPTDAAVLLGLAHCYYDAADMDQSQRLLGELLTAHPGHIAGLVESGRLALQRRRLAEAEAILTRATELAPWQRDACRYLRISLEEQGKTEAARQCRSRLEALLAQDAELGRRNLRFLTAPFDPAANVATGKILLRNGQEEAGRHLLMSVLAFFPHYRPAHEALADFFAAAGQPRRAEFYRRLAAEDEP
jgi:tetratricopeptide (TPR) repeat protein